MKNHTLMLAVLAGAALAASGSAAAAGDAARGEQVFKAQCSACHLYKEGGSTPIGPQLYGVLGRKAGSWGNFGYTAAMKKSGITWDEATLDQYLENPYAVVPGAAMALTVPVAKNRADVIAYLASKPEALKQPDRKP